MANLLKLLKKPKTRPLPEFPLISSVNIPPASALLFYGGPAITEMFGERVYGHPYHPPAFHAALTVGDFMFINVGKFKTLRRTVDEMKSTRRIDVIIYDMSDAARAAIKYAALSDLDTPTIGFQLPTYGITDFLRFGLPWWKPSKLDICSENALELLAEGGVTGSDKPTYRSAPWHLLEHALANTAKCSIRTLWIGRDFRR